MRTATALAAVAATAIAVAAASAYLLAVATIAAEHAIDAADDAEPTAL